MGIDAIVLHSTDNVATAVQDLKKGQQAAIRLGRELKHVSIMEDIPYGHKFAVRKINNGENILKYGEVIGRATSDIETGCHAHVQNIESLRGRGDLQKEA
ncbi:UxaA family hydrolase [Sporomusa sp. GT1]|uniref:UxaA family hydrolase n=1 Tax=Sporomusa sp. GT1 TaxID=1534747 RepID=UPI00166BF93B|nr:UxaA family hydrolase [Sporomusa sp. GT1]